MPNAIKYLMPDDIYLLPINKRPKQAGEFAKAKSRLRPITTKTMIVAI
jgi:hypothetical protein